MKFSLQQFQKITSFPKHDEFELDLKEYLKGSLENSSDTDIKDIDLVKVQIDIFKIDFLTYRINYKVNTKLILPCTLTLEDVEYPMNIEFDETYTDDLYYLESDDYYPFENNSVDISEAVWSNIVINIPIRVVREDAYEILKSRNIILDEDLTDDENNL